MKVLILMVQGASDLGKRLETDLRVNLVLRHDDRLCPEPFDDRTNVWSDCGARQEDRGFSLGHDPVELIGNLADEILELAWGHGKLTLIALTGAIIGTYVTPPTDHKTLEHFYRTTRPFGLWGRFKRTLPPDLRAATTREHTYDLLALPFALGWQISLFLLPMELIIQNFQAFRWTLVVFIVSLVGMYFLWYRQLPPADAPVPQDSNT